MQPKKNIAAKVAYLGTFACTILILACLVTGNPQLIRSYPLAINFDSYQPISGGLRPSIPYHFRQVSTRTNLGQPESLVQRPIMLNSMPSYRMRSQVASWINAPSQIMQSTMRVSFTANPEPHVSSTETSTNYQKRTLGSEATGPISPDNYKDLLEKKEKLESRRTNSSGLSEAQQLLLIRQKMIDMQGHINVSIEDTNWKIAANCLSNQFGSQFIRNKDVKCASSQVVLSISRMQRAGCKSCESYFHCEGFSRAIKRCKDNYDVQDTLNVMRECQGLTNGEAESIEATRAPLEGVDCQKKYLCGKNCKYNPLDGTCPRNNCYQARIDENTRLYKSHTNDRRGRITSGVAYPAESPIKNRTSDQEN